MSYINMYKKAKDLKKIESRFSMASYLKEQSPNNISAPGIGEKSRKLALVKRDKKTPGVGHYHYEDSNS